MQRCAVVASSNWLIQNVIVASANDAPPDGTFLIQVPDGLPVDTTYKVAVGFGFLNASEQRFFTTDIAAVPIDSPSARALVTAEIHATADALIARSTASGWAGQVNSNVDVLLSEIAQLETADLYRWQSHGWPTLPSSIS